MARLVAILALLVGSVAVVSATVPGTSDSPLTKTTATVGPTRLLSPDFGYTVAYKTVERGDTAHTTIGLFVYDHGRWSNVTPPRLDANAIDDVAFVDRRHGWVAAYNCGQAAVHLYRTRDGGRSWQSLGKPATHSCGGGPTFLSFVDPRRGWMEPISPNGPGGELLRTDDGGRTWNRLGSGLGSPALPCLAPIAFVSRRVGWMARCGPDVFATHDAGRHWRRVPVRVPYPRHDRSDDLPRFVGKLGVLATTLGRSRSSAVAFSVTRDGGHSWSVRSLRRIARCPLRPNLSPWPAFWPASVAGRRVWWIVAGGRQTLVQVTTHAGLHWRGIVAKGLPLRACPVESVSAADARVAWAVASYGSSQGNALYETRNGGHTWRRITLLR